MNTHSNYRTLGLTLIITLVSILSACSTVSAPTPAVSISSATRAAAPMPPVGHIFLIVLENEPFSRTFGKASPAPYLARTLPAQGAMLSQFYGIGHSSLDNYIAMISGQAPNHDTQRDCGTYSEFKRSAPGVDANGQVLGNGCVYPADIPTVAGQLQAATLDWRGYMEDMGADPSREADTCAHPELGARDHSGRASKTDRYATKHNPFVYFHSIIDDSANCAKHVVNLKHLRTDMANIATTPQFSFITPNLCHDGHNQPCRNGEPGGLVSADRFLRTWVPRITASPAFRKDGLLIITFDEGTDGKACCGEIGLPGGPKAGVIGPGGGRIGAVALSPWITPGTVSDVRYNHYSMLRSIEDIFGLKHLGYADMPNLKTFGPDVFTRKR